MKPTNQKQRFNGRNFKKSKPSSTGQRTDVRRSGGQNARSNDSAFPQKRRVAFAQQRVPNRILPSLLGVESNQQVRLGDKVQGVDGMRFMHKLFRCNGATFRPLLGIGPVFNRTCYDKMIQLGELSSGYASVEYFIEPSLSLLYKYFVKRETSEGRKPEDSFRDTMINVKSLAILAWRVAKELEINDVDIENVFILQPIDKLTPPQPLALFSSKETLVTQTLTHPGSLLQGEDIVVFGEVPDEFMQTHDFITHVNPTYEPAHVIGFLKDVGNDIIVTNVDSNQISIVATPDQRTGVVNFLNSLRACANSKLDEISHSRQGYVTSMQVLNRGVILQGCPDNIPMRVILIAGLYLSLTESLPDPAVEALRQLKNRRNSLSDDILFPLALTFAYLVLRSTPLGRGMILGVGASPYTFESGGVHVELDNYLRQFYKVAISDDHISVEEILEAFPESQALSCLLTFREPVVRSSQLQELEEKHTRNENLALTDDVFQEKDEIKEVSSSPIAGVISGTKDLIDNFEKLVEQGDARVQLSERERKATMAENVIKDLFSLVSNFSKDLTQVVERLSHIQHSHNH